MLKIGRLFLRLRALFGRNRLEAEMEDELRFHLDRQIEDNIAGGMTREEARRAALRSFGGVDQIKEQCRDARGTRFLREVWQDLRYGLRMLRRSPAFAAAAVLSLALGIGVNTAIFTLIDALMLRMLPVEHPEELIVLKKVHPIDTDDQFSYAAYVQFRDDASDFAGMLAATMTDTVNIFLNGEPELVSRQSVSGNYFAVLGVRPVLGRVLEPGDDRLPGGEPVAVISYGFWQRRFGRDPSVLGQKFTFKGTAFSIVGVGPAEFFGETVGKAPDIWTPVTVQPAAPSWLWRGHSVTWLRMVGRLGPGITREQARSRLEPIFQRMQSEIASGMKETRFRNQVLETRFRVEDGSLGLSELRERFSLSLRILMAVVGLVLMIACANVANLLLARAAARQREFAVRLAIGAGRARVIRQLLTESVLISALGGTFGLALSQWGSKVLVLLVSRASAPIPLDLRPDARILAFTAGLSLLTGILFGLAPALRATRFDLAPSLKESTERGRGRFGLAKTLVAAQVAVSLLLLAGAGLFVRSLQKLESIDTGFDPEQVLLFSIDPRATGYKITELAGLYRRLLERAESVPGVRAASGSFFGLFTGATWGNTLTVEGYTPRAGEAVHSLANAVSARYFEVMRIPILHGRSISWSDHQNAPRVAVVNQTFARRYFGAADPIGKRFGLGSPAKEMIEIVGVAKDAKYVHLRETTRPMLYVPFLQYPSGLTELEIRAAGDPAALAATLRRELAAVDRNLPILGVTSMGEQVAASIAAERLIAKLSSAFGLLALLLACIGLYGVLAYTVSRRTSEIGLRIALGARPRDVRWLVLRESFLLILIGSAAGLAAALAAGRWISSQLFGVAPDDPLILSLATISMLAVGSLAGYLPARRASRVDPMAALRYE